MLPAPPHYEPLLADLLQGDIGYFPFVQLVLADEAGLLPSTAQPPPERGVPSIIQLKEYDVAIDGVAYTLRSWHGLGLIIDQTSELRNSPTDSRVTVAALVPIQDAGVNADAAMAGQLVGTFVLPECAARSAVGGLPAEDWPSMVVTLRSVSTLSRAIVQSSRMMTLTPPMAAVLAHKLAEFYAERTWARIKHFDNVLGAGLVRVDDLGKQDGPPQNGRWVLLSFSNHERLQVFASPRT